MDTKKSLREFTEKVLLSQNLADRAARSRLIREKLWRLPEFIKSELILFYVSRAEEVDTHVMIEQALADGKKVAVPCSDLKSHELSFFQIQDLKRNLRPGIFGILEPDPQRTQPVAPHQADLVVVPGVVFDRDNNRIGHGAGFFDRFLKEIRHDTPIIALAFSFQMVEKLPQEKHDVPMDLVITD